MSFEICLKVEIGWRHIYSVVAHLVSYKPLCAGFTVQLVLFVLRRRIIDAPPIAPRENFDVASLFDEI
jgi:hypothetical protein